jgi:dolichol-phosphate mannosyltransferase
MNKLSIVIPCYNEETTLAPCVERVFEIQDQNLELELIIVDDASSDKSLEIANKLRDRYKEIKVFHHDINQGKGAALRTGFKVATGDFVAVQDADLEYDPFDLKNLIKPLIKGEADVVLGSRFLSAGAHRVLYFWHSMGNRFLTFLSNMFTDLNLTDMETCYKVFKRDVIQAIEIEENRFGFEPEIVAKIAHKRLRVFETGISYNGRTYEEGKKIGAMDGLRALYCIIRYNASHAPVFLQLMVYILIGGTAALFNLAAFMGLYAIGIDVFISAPVAFMSAAAVNYFLCISILFRHQAKWGKWAEIFWFLTLVLFICMVDWGITGVMLSADFVPWKAKITATAGSFLLNFVARRFIVFPEPESGEWKPQVKKNTRQDN